VPYRPVSRLPEAEAYTGEQFAVSGAAGLHGLEL